MGKALVLLLLGCLHVLALRVQALPLVLQLCFQLMLLLPQHGHCLQQEPSSWAVLTAAAHTLLLSPQDVRMLLYVML